MTTTLNASTSAGLIITPDTSGNIQLQYNGVSTPIFSAYATTTTSMSNAAWTKIVYVTEIVDSNNNYDTTNSRYTPTVAGWYMFNGSNSTNSNLTASNIAFSIWKNGNEYIRGSGCGASSAQAYTTVSGIVYMNGTTDYVELYQYQNSGSAQNNQTGSITSLTAVFQGCLLRGT